MTDERRAALPGIVTIDKGIMHGTPCFTGTRVPVQTLLDFIEAGDTLDKFLEPSLGLNASKRFNSLNWPKNNSRGMRIPIDECLRLTLRRLTDLQ